MRYAEHSRRLGLGGLTVRRLEEDGTVVTVEITPLFTMKYRCVERATKVRLHPKWLFKLLYLAWRRDFTRFFFWATFLARADPRLIAAYLLTVSIAFATALHVRRLEEAQEHRP